MMITLSGQVRSQRALFFPEGSKMKEERSADGSGEVMDYEDTTEAILRSQDEGDDKARKQTPKPGYRY